MKRRNVAMLSLSLCCALLGGVTWLASMNAAQGFSWQQGSDAQPSVNLTANLNEKAKAVKGGEEAPIRDLTDVIFKTVALDEAPAGILDAVKDRIVRAEVSYRNGKSEGILEINVVKAVNGLALKFKAPEYAKTSVYEVRKLRVSSLALMPNFIAAGRPSDAGQARKVGSTINTKMSPAEATFITALLLRQKLSNPDYQMTHAERVTEWAQQHGNKQDAKAKQPKAANRAARQEEMEKVIARGAAEISPIDLLNIPNTALNILGVQE